MRVYLGFGILVYTTHPPSSRNSPQLPLALVGSACHHKASNPSLHSAIPISLFRFPAEEEDDDAK